MHNIDFVLHLNKKWQIANEANKKETNDDKIVATRVEKNSENGSGKSLCVINIP